MEASVETYQLTTPTGRPIRKATRVRFADGTVVRFLDRLPRQVAIEAARELREADLRGGAGLAGTAARDGSPSPVLVVEGQLRGPSAATAGAVLDHEQPAGHDEGGETDRHQEADALTHGESSSDKYSPKSPEIKPDSPAPKASPQCTPSDLMIASRNGNAIISTLNSISQVASARRRESFTGAEDHAEEKRASNSTGICCPECNSPAWLIALGLCEECGFDAVAALEAHNDAEDWQHASMMADGR